MAVTFGNLPPGPSGFNPSTYSQYRDPSTPPPQQKGGSWKWDVAKGAWDFIKGNAGDIISTVGSGIEAYMSSEDRAKQLEELRRQYDLGLKQRQDEQTTSAEQYEKDLQERIAGRTQGQGQFERTTGNTEAQAAVRAQTQLNAAPMADKAQALLLSRMGVAPGQFQGRDYTKGTSDLTRSAVAPSSGVTSAMQSAAAGYRPGDGGVDTSTMRMLLDKMRASGFRPETATAPPGETRPRLRIPPTLPPGSELPPPSPRPPSRMPPVPPGAFPPPTTQGPPPPQIDTEEDDSPAAIVRRRMTGVT